MGQPTTRRFARARAAVLLGVLGALSGATAACDALIGTEDRFFEGDAAPAPADGRFAPDASQLVDAADAAATAEAGPGTSYVAAVVADAPVAWWRFEEPAGSTVATDQIADAAAVATGTGATFAVPGAVGNAVSFDGTSYLDVGDNFDLTGFQEFSFEAWVKATWVDYENLIVKRDSDGNGYVLYVASGPHAQFEESYQHLGDAVVSATPADTSVFVHVVVTFTRAAGVQMYLNGVSALPSNTFTMDGGVPGPVATNLFLVEGLSGTLDEVAIYGHALSPQRVSAHYQAGLASR